VITWMLNQMEKSPYYSFYQAELLARSKSLFKKLKDTGFLLYIQPNENGMSYHCNVRKCLECCPMQVHKENGKYFARCPKDDRVAPQPLTAEDIARYKLNLNVVAEKFRETNLLTGRPSGLDQHLFYLGEAQAGGLALAIILGLFSSPRKAMKSLLTLPNMVSGRYDRILVIFPSLEIADQTDLVRLEKLNIFPVNLDKKNPFTIDLSTALKKPPEKPVEVTLTPEEEKEFARHQFKSRITIEITGDIEKQATNILRVDGVKKVPLGDTPFALFLRLVLELRKGGDGCVYKGDSTHGGGLIDEGFLKPDSVDQDIRRLREPFITALKGLPPTKFIEVFKQKHIRLSTHPVYIFYDKNRLLLHENHKIKQLAKKLP